VLRVTPKAPPSNTDSPSLCARPPRQCRGEASFRLDRLVSCRFRGGRFLPGCHGPTSAIHTVETKTRISCALRISIGRALGHDATPLARTRGRPWFHATMNASVDRCWSVDLVDRRTGDPRGVGVFFPRRQRDRTSDAPVVDLLRSEGVRLSPDPRCTTLHSVEAVQLETEEEDRVRRQRRLVKRRHLEANRDTFREQGPFVCSRRHQLPLERAKTRGARDRLTLRWTSHRPVLVTRTRNLCSPRGIARHGESVRTSFRRALAPGCPGEKRPARPPFTRACHLFRGAFRELI